MANPGYWERITNARLSRRRALAGAAAAGTGVAALSLVGCGGASEEGGGATTTPKDPTGLLGERIDTSKDAKKGGTYLAQTGADVTSFDPLSSPSFTTHQASGWVYSRLLKVKPGHITPSTNEVEGDLAESWEVSQDGLQLTFNLRQNAKWDSRAPTSSRPVSAEDVVFSWNKFARLAAYRADLSHEANPAAPIESVTAPDARTVVVKLAFPDAAALTMLGSDSHLFIMPMESDGGFDPKGETRGSSAWFLEQYKPSGGFLYARNPNWYRSDIPFLDKYDFTIIQEYAQGLAQLRAGHIYGFGVKQEDILSTKRDMPDLVMLASGFNRLWYNSWFGYEGSSPFKDERVRQAWSLSYDRNLWIETFGGAQDFLKIGLPVEMRWHSHLSSGLDGWWVDPKDEKAFGPNARYFKFDPAEAKKLLTAAGFASGLDTTAIYVTTFQYGQTFPSQCDVQLGFARDVGIRTKVETPDYQTRWLPEYYYAKGAFNGIALGADNTELDVGAAMFARFHPDGPRFKGYSPDGGDPKKGDPKVTELINKVRQEFDLEKRRALVKEYQQYMAKAMYDVPFPGQAAGYTLTWPCTGNLGAFRYGGQGYGYGVEVGVHTWLDTTKPPINKA